MDAPLPAGTKLGRYEIRSKIGAGGMGEVYLARDSELGREVAVKVLPSSFSADTDRLRRFQQEACAAGALNHPNILSIYDVGKHDGSPYVVSELLEGDTLRQRIAGSPLNPRRAIEYALQIANGLAAAHEKGIIHRDLKPDNIFITNDSRVKILDFGLAKLTQLDGDQAQTDIPTRRVDTDPGVVMGTVGYMSPEQLKGRAVDQRSDIFSFGAILYEMLSGRRAFHGESAAETMSAILKEDPPELSETNKAVSPGLERLVHHCLEKNPESRFHSASDLAFALEALTSAQSSGDTTVVSAYTDQPSRGRLKFRDWLGWVAAALLLISTITLAALYFRRVEPRRETMRFALTAPEKTTFGDSLALSPDGRLLAFIALAATGEPTLWVRTLDSVDAQKLQGTEGAATPFWSPDGRYIGFFAGGKLKTIEASGGPIQILTETSADPRGGTWGPDGTIIFSPNPGSPLLKVSVKGGPATQITEFDQQRSQTSHRWPWFLPDGRHYLYFGRGKKQFEGIFVGSLDTSEKKFLLGSRVRGIYTGTAGDPLRGYLLYIHEGTLLARPFDVSKLEFSGESTTIAQHVLSYPSEFGPTGNCVISVSTNGHLVFRTGGPPVTRPAWEDRAGKGAEPIVPAGVYREPMISADGKKIALSRQLEGAEDIWLIDASHDVTLTRFTFDPAADVSPIWTPDGSHVIFASNRNGKFELYQKGAGGAGAEELILSADGNCFPHGVTPDGRYVLFEKGGGPRANVDIWAVPTFGDRKPFAIVESDFFETHAQFSGDGHWVAYVSDESGRAEVYVQSFPSSGGKWQISTAGGDQPMWNPRGGELFYMAPDRSIVSVSYKVADHNFQTGQRTALFATRVQPSSMVDDRNSYALSPDGKRFLVNNLVDEVTSTPLTLVLNWDADLKK
jgi:eukaryotic-like serine/threonine-protein kinase